MLKVQFAAMQRMTGWTARVVAIHGLCGEWQLRAKTANSFLALRALAALKLLHEREDLRCERAQKAVIHVSYRQPFGVAW